MSRKMSLRREIRLKREPVTGRARRERKREKVIVTVTFCATPATIPAFLFELRRKFTNIRW